jgi:hypothetical protein
MSENPKIEKTEKPILIGVPGSFNDAHLRRIFELVLANLVQEISNVVAKELFSMLKGFEEATKEAIAEAEAKKAEVGAK